MTISVLSPELAELHIRSRYIPGQPAGFSIASLPGVKVTTIADREHDLWLKLPRNVFQIDAVRDIVQLVAGHQPRWPEAPQAPIVLNRQLLKHQHIAVDRAIARGGMLLGDQMGLAKTSSAAAAAAHRLKAEPHKCVLILGPSYLASVWRAELEVMGLLDGAPFWQARGLDRQNQQATRSLLGAKWLFCHYDILREWWPILQHSKFSSVIFDEAHLLKNYKSQRTRAAQMVTTGTAMRLALTGTPIQNRIGEAHTLLSLVTGQWSWGSGIEFRQRYVGAERDGYGWRDGSPQHESELQSRLDDIYLRRDIDALDEPLPPRTRTKLVVDLDLTTPEGAAVQTLLKGYTPKQVFDAIRRGRTGTDTLGWLSKLRKATSLAKFSATVTHARSILEQGSSVVVFTWERSMAKKIGKALALAAVVTGEDDMEARDTIVRAWKARPDPMAMVATLGSLSTGVTLTKANHVIFHDLDFVPATMLQGEGRVYRIGQSKPSHSWWAVLEGSIDPFVFNLVNRKAPIASLFGDTNTGDLGDFFGADVADAELEDLFAWSMENA